MVSPEEEVELEGVDEPEPSARPAQRQAGAPDDEERVVPVTNVGGAAPTAGGDSGGDLPGAEDDLANLSEPEPPGAPELGGVSVRRGEPARGPEADGD